MVKGSCGISPFSARFGIEAVDVVEARQRDVDVVDLFAPFRETADQIDLAGWLAGELDRAAVDARAAEAVAERIGLPLASLDADGDRQARGLCQRPDVSIGGQPALRQDGDAIDMPLDSVSACEERSTAAPSWVTRSIDLVELAPRETGSSPLVGSSSKSRSGLPMSA